MVDKLIDVTDSFDTDPKHIRLTAIAGDPDSAHAVAVSSTNLDIRDLTATDVVTTLPTAGTVSTGSYDALNETSLSVDCSNYRSVSIQITGTWVGTLTFQGSNDNSNWNMITGWNGLMAAVSIRTTNDIVSFAMQHRYFQVKATAWTSGTATVTGFFHPDASPPAPAYLFLSSVTPGTGATSLGKAIDGAVGATDTGVASLAKRVTTPATITPANGDYTPLQVDDNGRLWVSPAESTTPTLYNITLTLADTEYSQALPAGTRSVRFMARTAVAIRFAFATGKVATPTAPWATLPANAGYAQEHIYLASSTIYFASDDAGVVVELEVWA